MFWEDRPFQRHFWKVMRRLLIDHGPIRWCSLQAQLLRGKVCNAIQFVNQTCQVRDKISFCQKMFSLFSVLHLTKICCQALLKLPLLQAAPRLISGSHHFLFKGCWLLCASADQTVFLYEVDLVLHILKTWTLNQAKNSYTAKLIFLWVLKPFNAL